MPAIAGGDGKRIRNALLVIAAIYIIAQTGGAAPIDPMTGVAAGAEGAGGYATVQTATATKGLSTMQMIGLQVALVYGQHRVAGQFLSGYVNSLVHGSGDPISIGAQFDGI